MEHSEPMDEEDLVGDAIVKMLQHEPDSLTGRFEYAKLTVRSVVMDHFKKSNRESMCELDESMEPEGQSLHSEVLIDEYHEEIKKKLLQEGLYETYILVYKNGLKLGAVASLQDVSLATVKRRIQDIKTIVGEIL